MELTWSSGEKQQHSFLHSRFFNYRLCLAFFSISISFLGYNQWNCRTIRPNIQKKNWNSRLYTLQCEIFEQLMIIKRRSGNNFKHRQSRNGKLHRIFNMSDTWVYMVFVVCFFLPFYFAAHHYNPYIFHAFHSFFLSLFFCLQVHVWEIWKFMCLKR